MTETTRDLLTNNDVIAVEERLGQFAPDLRCAFRWVAFRAAARECRAWAHDLLDRAAALDAAAAAELQATREDQ